MKRTTVKRTRPKPIAFVSTNPYRTLYEVVHRKNVIYSTLRETAARAFLDGFNGEHGTRAKIVERCLPRSTRNLGEPVPKKVDLFVPVKLNGKMLLDLTTEKSARRFIKSWNSRRIGKMCPVRLLKLSFELKSEKVVK